MRSSSGCLSLVTGRNNPFWNSVLRRTRRRGEVDDWLLPLVLLGLGSGVWFATHRLDYFPDRFPYGPWHFIVAAQALAIVFGTGLRAARMLQELSEPGNLIALRLSRLGPGLTIAGKAVEPFLVGTRRLAVRREQGVS